MSRHYFETFLDGQAITVVLGWDRPLQHAYMFVERIGTDREDEYPYSSLADNELGDIDGHGLAPLDHYRKKLADLSIVVPESMFEQTTLDLQRGTGNRVAVHTAYGTWRDELSGT